jgi:hypothetical protein
MDVVLFGPPKEAFSTWKDAILTSLLIVAVTCLFLAYRQNKRSQVCPRHVVSNCEITCGPGTDVMITYLKYFRRKIWQKIGIFCSYCC